MNPLSVLDLLLLLRHRFRCTITKKGDQYTETYFVIIRVREQLWNVRTKDLVFQQHKFEKLLETTPGEYMK